MNRIGVLGAMGLNCLLGISATFAKPPDASPKQAIDQLLHHIPPIPPGDSLKTFRIEPGFRIELAAAEPNVADPVDIAWDENGRLFVCELWNYPGVPKEGEPLGRIRLLTSSHNDGVYDESTVFADNLRWPSGIICWDGGVYVISSPDIWYLKDTRSDGVADVKKKIFTGLHGQTYEVGNSLRWGPDNRIYVCGSYAGGNLRRIDERADPVHSRDFRFDPRTNVCEPVSGGGEWGASFNDWGDKFNCDATDLCYHTILPRAGLAQNPSLAASEVQENSAGSWSHVFPISQPEPWKVARQKFWSQWVNTSHDFNSGRFPPNELAPHGFATSACGATIYRGSAFSPAFQNSEFIGEPANNVVVRLELKEDGVRIRGSRAADDADREFLASTDNRFRPVNFANGPDGCLYVVAMYREIIEDETAIPSDILGHYDLYSGRDLGRIYRIVPENFRPPAPPRLGKAQTLELVAALASPDYWVRETAQRLLYQKQDRSAIEPLRRLAHDSTLPQGRIHALWTLQGYGGLNAKTVADALSDPDGHVREQAAILSSELLPTSPELGGKLIALASDPSIRVRFRTAFALGQVRDDKAIDALAEIARQDSQDKWMACAVAAAAPGRAGKLFSALLAAPATEKKIDDQRLPGLLAQAIGVRHDPAEVARFLADISGPSASLRKDSVVPLLRQFADGLARGGSSLPELLSDPAVASHKEALAGFFQRSAKIAGDDRRPEGARIEAIELLAHAPYEQVRDTLVAVLDPKESTRLQVSAVRAISSHADARVPGDLLSHWQGFGPAVRPEVIDALFRRPERLPALLDAIKAGKFPAGELTPSRKNELLTSNDAALRDSAKALLGSTASADRQKLIDRYRADILRLPGDPARGKIVFQNTCAICHQPEHGARPGPNLAVLEDRSPDTLLVAILDPNREVKPAFVNYMLVTQDGQTLSGVIADESANSVTLRYPGGGEDTLLRRNIKSLRSTGISLMPEGLEAALNPQQMADLLSYLRVLKD